jgi:hypothetical protein
MVYSANRYLTLAEMTVNAQYILNYLLSKGWTKNAVCGMLGNMQTESTINPGIWEGLDANNLSRGYGLVQWTPASKYIDWATANGLQSDNIDSQLKRIEYEVSTNTQWFGGYSSTMSFYQFTQSMETPEYLADVFIRTYEHPANPDQPIRGTQARYWFDNLTGDGSSGGYQLALFPMDMIHITQGENGSYSHQGTWNIDFVGSTLQYPYYAPCDCECIHVDVPDAYIVWKSSNPVMCVDGVVRNITWMNIHQANIPYTVGQKLKKGELMGTTGNAGNSSGDHWHFQVIEGSEYLGWQYVPDSEMKGNRLHIYDVFAINNVTTIVEGLGYNWRTSDYVDGTPSGNGGGAQKDNVKDLMMFYLSNALHW